MPPKKKFSRDQIIDAAFEIARLEGIDRITIRKVAEQLKSSIAPIYVNFTDVNELIQEVVYKTFAIGKKLLDEQRSGNPFQNIGLAGIRFATQYPVLFRDIVLKPNPYMQRCDQELGLVLVEQMKADPMLKGFTEKELLLIMLKMKIFQTGLSVMAANGGLPDSLNEAALMEIMDRTAIDIVAGTRLCAGVL